MLVEIDTNGSRVSSEWTSSQFTYPTWKQRVLNPNSGRKTPNVLILCENLRLEEQPGLKSISFTKDMYKQLYNSNLSNKRNKSKIFSILQLY